MSVINTDSYNYNVNDKFLLDTNILLYVFNSYNPDLECDKSKIIKYSDFLNTLLLENAEIYITLLNMSEFVNVIIQREFKLFRKSFSHECRFKDDFRPSKSYKDVILALQSILPNLNKSLKLLNDNFDKSNINNLLDLDNIDFNDKYFIETVKVNNLKLVTHDKDFKSYAHDIDIITANRALLHS